jgi:hypothetical protein
MTRDCTYDKDDSNATWDELTANSGIAIDGFWCAVVAIRHDDLLC